jgi:hypothetical protein
MVSGDKPKRRRVSAAGRRRMSEAGKKRWAKSKEEETNGEVVNLGAILTAGPLCLKLRQLVGTDTAIKMLKTFEASLGVGGTNA